MSSIIDDILDELIGRKARTREHTHCCGFTLDEKGATQSGCGHKWTHRMSDFDSQESYDEGHNCPKCGKGPWRWQLCDATLKEHDRRKAAGELA